MDSLLSILKDKPDTPEILRFIKNFYKVVNKIESYLPEDRNISQFKTMLPFLTNRAILETFVSTFTPWDEHIDRGDDSFIEQINNPLVKNYFYLEEHNKKTLLKDMGKLLTLGKYAITCEA